MRKKAYKSLPVKGVDVAASVSRLPEGRLVVGIDVGKSELLVVLREVDGTMLRPWAFRGRGSCRCARRSWGYAVAGRRGLICGAK